MKASHSLPDTLGALRPHKPSVSGQPGGVPAPRSVKDELRANLICKLQRDEPLFPGIVGYADTNVPQEVNAVLSRHIFILLALRGRAKTRLVLMLTTLLVPFIPCVAVSEIHDNPYRPISKFARELS